MDAVRDWLRTRWEDLDSRAARHGAILFRGFPVRTARDFDAFVGSFGYANFAYDESLSNAVRTNLTPRVFTANEAPPTATIKLHHELAQTPRFPSRLLFFCERPAERGGATALCRSDALFEELQRRLPAFARACEEKGLIYSNVMPAENDPSSGQGRSWRSTFGIERPEQAEARMRHLGYRWEWLPDGCLRATTPALPAVRELGPGRKSFFNQLIAAFAWTDTRNDPTRSLVFGDGSPIDPIAAAQAAELAEAMSVDLEWQAGDVALVDNYSVMHGRRSFGGSRRVLASLVA